MNKYYIANFESTSGISHYSKIFYERVLSKLGYIHINSQLKDCLKNIEYNDIIHLEIGVKTFNEIEILNNLITKNVKNISVTLHDPPFIDYPYFKSSIKVVNIFFKIVHVYLKNFGLNRFQYKSIKKIFVLSNSAKEILQNKYKLDNIYTIPFIIEPINKNKFINVENFSSYSQNFIFFGFIDKRKGLHYALNIHSNLLSKYPNSLFYIIGKPAGKKSEKYLNTLKKNYTKNTTFLNYLEKNELEKIFEKAKNVILPFKEYKLITPTSGSIINSLCLGKIVFSTNVNAVSELIIDGYNGFILTGNIEEDCKKIQKVIENDYLQKDVLKNSFDFLNNKHSAENVIKLFCSEKN